LHDLADVNSAFPYGATQSFAASYEFGPVIVTVRFD
jgi:hypothetical protein